MSESDEDEVVELVWEHPVATVERMLETAQAQRSLNEFSLGRRVADLREGRGDPADVERKRFDAARLTSAWGNAASALEAFRADPTRFDLARQAADVMAWCMFEKSAAELRKAVDAIEAARA